jgi:hypothetical protein
MDLISKLFKKEKPIVIVEPAMNENYRRDSRRNAHYYETQMKMNFFFAKWLEKAKQRLGQFIKENPSKIERYTFHIVNQQDTSDLNYEECVVLRDPNEKFALEVRKPFFEKFPEVINTRYLLGKKDAGYTPEELAEIILNPSYRVMKDSSGYVRESRRYVINDIKSQTGLDLKKS